MGCTTIFVTGTDTGVGKTRVASGLLRAAQESGLKVCGYKPVASGCDATAQGLRNADALAMFAAAGSSEPYDKLNPYAFAPAIAPHLAALEDGRSINLHKLSAVHRDLAKRHELIVVEGAGGWMVPLTPKKTLADWVAGHGWPVVLVVGMRLGAINHALLSAAQISRTNPLLGWIASELSPRQPRLDENIDALASRISAPLLGRVGPRRLQLRSEFAQLRALLA